MMTGKVARDAETEHCSAAHALLNTGARMGTQRASYVLTS